MLLCNAEVLNEQFELVKGDLLVENGKIAGLYPCGGAPAPSDGETMECTGRYVLPGLIDIHTHGCAGADAGDGDFDSYCAMSEFYAAHGVTTFLATTSTISHEALINAAKTVKRAMEEGTPGAAVGGMHMEGPYFSYKYKGAQNPAHLRIPSVSEVKEIDAVCDGAVRLISIAPELEGAEEFIAEAKGCAAVALGHTDADYATAKAAICAGATVLTHTCNAMRSLHHREPGALGAALESDIFCELISDGVHVHPAMVQLIYRMVGEKRLVLISDSLRAAGMADGEYDLGGQQFIVRDGRATLPDGTIAGSTENLLSCMRCAVKFGIPLEHAARCAAYNPACAVGLDDRGVIASGKRADLIVLDRALELQTSIVNGKIVYTKS